MGCVCVLSLLSSSTVPHAAPPPRVRGICASGVPEVGLLLRGPLAAPPGRLAPLSSRSAALADNDDKGKISKSVYLPFAPASLSSLCLVSPEAAERFPNYGITVQLVGCETQQV